MPILLRPLVLLGLLVSGCAGSSVGVDIRQTPLARPDLIDPPAKVVADVLHYFPAGDELARAGYAPVDAAFLRQMLAETTAHVLLVWSNPEIGYTAHKMVVLGEERPSITFFPVELPVFETLVKVLEAAPLPTETAERMVKDTQFYRGVRRKSVPYGYRGGGTIITYVRDVGQDGTKLIPR